MAEHCYAECRSCWLLLMLSVIMLNVVILSVVAPFSRRTQLKVIVQVCMCTRKPFYIEQKSILQKLFFPPLTVEQTLWLFRSWKCFLASWTIIIQAWTYSNGAPRLAPQCLQILDKPGKLFKILSKATKQQMYDASCHFVIYIGATHFYDINFNVTYQIILIEREA